MAKRNNKDAYYFSHDSNARNDPKILALRFVHGAEGYAVYFMLIEILREQPGYKLLLTEYTWQALSMQMSVPADKVKEIITDCCTKFTDGENNEPLIVNDGKYLSSASLLSRMARADEISATRKAAIEKRWKRKKQKDSATPDGGPDEASENTSEVHLNNTCISSEEEMNYISNTMKRKERKGKEKKGNEKKDNIPPISPQGDCAEPEKSDSPPEPPVVTLALNTGEEWPVTEQQVREWQELFPGVDVMQQLRNMRAWCISNPEKRKTAKGVKRFVTAWLTREQDKGGKRQATTPMPKRRDGYDEEYARQFRETWKDWESL